MRVEQPVSLARLQLAFDALRLGAPVLGTVLGGRRLTLLPCFRLARAAQIDDLGHGLLRSQHLLGVDDQVELLVRHVAAADRLLA